LLKLAKVTAMYLRPTVSGPPEMDSHRWRDAGAVVSTAGGTARQTIDSQTIWPVMSFALFEFQIGTRLERLV
jgi:hypothetical protein